MNASCPPVNLACQSCVRASGAGSCAIKYGWDWNVGMAENDAKSSLPGMQIVRGMDALAPSTAGVAIVSRWKQSNWPAITRDLAPTLVRAASPQDKERLCRLWRREHSYQSWPVMLGCPGTWPIEHEPACGNEGAVISIPCASVDLTSDPVIAGGIYDATRFFRVTHSQHPPEVCKARKEVWLPALGVAISVYPTALGHFVPEQLPAALLLHAHLPPHVPIVVADASVPRRYIQPLIDSGVVPPGRFHFQPMRSDGTVMRAKRVYTVLNSHFSNAMSGDVAMRAARHWYNPHGAVPLARRTTVLVVDRAGGRRSVRNKLEVGHLVERAIAETATDAPVPMRMVHWRPNPQNMSAYAPHAGPNPQSLHATPLTDQRDRFS